jgi:hypothetical protein
VFSKGSSPSLMYQLSHMSFAAKRWGCAACSAALRCPSNSVQQALVFACMDHTSQAAAGCPTLLPQDVANTRNTSVMQVHPCDKRRSITEIKKQFPGVDFTMVADDEDTLWKPDVRESPAEIKVRSMPALHMLNGGRRCNKFAVRVSELSKHVTVTPCRRRGHWQALLWLTCLSSHAF